MTSRVSSKNKEKKAKRKISVKKKRPNRKKNFTKKQKTASPGVEPGLSARSSTTVKHMTSKINFVIPKQFFSAIDAV